MKSYSIVLTSIHFARQSHRILLFPHLIEYFVDSICFRKIGLCRAQAVQPRPGDEIRKEIGRL